MLKLIYPTTLILILLQSCAFHSGTMTGNAAISDANFTVAGFASGTSQSIYIFQIGGIGKDGMVLEAKRNMYAAYPLEPGQAFANVTVDFKRGYYIFYAKTVCTITADIIDFNKPNRIIDMDNNKDFTDFNLEFTENIINKLNNFKIGEQVYYAESTLGAPIGSTITAFSNGKAQVRYVKSNGIIEHTKVNVSNLYKIKNDSSLKNIDPIYQIGDSVYFTSNISFNLVRGQIFALGYMGACIVYEQNNEKEIAIVRRADFRTMRTVRMEQNKNNLHGSWRLIALGDKKIVNNTKTPTLVVNSHDLKLSGFGGCNQYFASFKLTENAVSFSAIGATRKACLEENIENDYFNALGVRSFTIKRKSNTLVLKNDETTLEFMLEEQM